VAGPWQPQAAAGCCGVFLPPQKAQCNLGSCILAEER